MKSLQVQVCLGARTVLSPPSGRVATSCMSMLTLLVVLLWSSPGWSFGGFFVSEASGALSNTATQVVLLREGKRTVLSMQNNYQGPPKDFAMVVPVPVILQKENVKTLKPKLFAKLDTLTSPRLVEYWEKDPCDEQEDPERSGTGFIHRDRDLFFKTHGPKIAGWEMRLKAEFQVGEYDIVILEAKDSGDLESWLKAQNYNIPKGAAKVLAPYVSQGMYFLVAKVDASKVKFGDDGQAELSPLRFHYDSDEFSLPVRLGMLNANGPQDLVVHILARGSRYRVKNRPNVAIPTNLVVSSKVKKDFGGFYAALFEQVQAQNPGAVVTEYARNVGACDPCFSPVISDTDLHSFGLDTLLAESPMFAHIKHGDIGSVKGALTKHTVRYVENRHLDVFKRCYEREFETDDSVKGEVSLKYVIGSDGDVGLADVVDNTTKSKALGACLISAVKTMQFPRPGDGGSVVVEKKWAFVPLPLSPPSYSRWFVTRLHTRHNAKGLSKDLVFEPAQPLLGGTGWPTGAKGYGGLGTTIEGGEASVFQARYIILNPWKGGMTCANPRRGVWEPPADLEVHNAPRGGLEQRASKRLGRLVVGGSMKATLLDGGR